MCAIVCVPQKQEGWLWVLVCLASPDGSAGKESVCSAGDKETRVQSLGREDLLEEEMATYSSILAWKNIWTEVLVCYSPWGCKTLDTAEHARTAATTKSSVKLC